MFYHKDMIKSYHEIFYKICYKRNFKISHKLINNDSRIENIEFILKGLKSLLTRIGNDNASEMK